jgi:hypothetical protein
MPYALRDTLTMQDVADSITAKLRIEYAPRVRIAGRTEDGPQVIESPGFTIPEQTVEIQVNDPENLDFVDDECRRLRLNVRGPRGFGKVPVLARLVVNDCGQIVFHSNGSIFFVSYDVEENW